MKNYENFRILDQKKIHFSKNKIQFWNLFCIINIVKIFIKNKIIVKYFFDPKRNFAFLKRKIHDLWNLFSALQKKKIMQINYSQHMKKNSKGLWIFLFKNVKFQR